MKENKYDDPQFFEQYKNFPRSVQGLSAAGEWHELKKMLPDFAGKSVLDIGCGFGWHCIYAAEQGAQNVVGTDISEKMLAEAREKTHFKNVHYIKAAMEEFDYGKEQYDVVISSLAFHYTENFKMIADRVYQCLRPGGSFVFSVEHPVFTAQGTQDWFYNGETKDHWPVDNYFMEGKRSAVFLGEQVTKYHKTMTTYLNDLIKSGFSITGIIEPQPDPALLDSVAGMRDELRRPMMLLVAAIKN